MTRILNKIKSADDIEQLNTNFDRIALDMADRSGAFSTVGTSLGGSLSAGATGSLEVSVVDNLNTYVLNKLPVIPRVLVYIDTDNDGTYLWPSGSNLTSATVHGIQIMVFTARTVINQVTNEKATYFIVVRNSDSVPHTLYIYTDCYYVPAPDEGVAKRATS